MIVVQEGPQENIVDEIEVSHSSSSTRSAHDENTDREEDVDIDCPQPCYSTESRCNHVPSSSLVLHNDPEIQQEDVIGSHDAEVQEDVGLDTSRSSSTIDLDENAHYLYKNELKVMLIECICYVVALMLTLGTQFAMTYYFYAQKPVPYALGILYLIFRPLQGLFNFLIFAGSKIRSLRKVNPNLTFRGALKLIFCKSNPSPVIISGLSRVEIATRLEQEGNVAAVPFARIAPRIVENSRPSTHHITRGFL